MSIYNGQEIHITAIPKRDNYNTSFTFHYHTTSKKLDDAEIWDKLEKHRIKVYGEIHDDIGLSTGVLIGIIGLCVVVTIGLSLGF